MFLYEFGKLSDDADCSFSFCCNVPEDVFVFKKERTDSVLRNVTCSADRSGYLIYQSDRKIVL